MKTAIYAKAAVLNGNGEVLLLRRSPTDPQRPGDQDFPGGQVEDGEEITAGVVREIQEETGIVVQAKKILLVYAATEAYEDRSVTRLFYMAQVGSPVVRLSHEHDDYRWLSIPEALEAFPHHVYGKGLQYAVDHGIIDTLVE